MYMYVFTLPAEFSETDMGSLRKPYSPLHPNTQTQTPSLSHYCSCCHHHPLSHLALPLGSLVGERWAAMSQICSNPRWAMERTNQGAN